MGRIRRWDSRKFFMLLTLTVWLGACHRWVEVAPPDFALEQQAAKATKDREELRLHMVGRDMQVEGFLAELTQDSTVLATDDGRVAISTPLIAQVDERRGDTLATIAVILVPVLLVLVIGTSSEGNLF